MRNATILVLSNDLRPLRRTRALTPRVCNWIRLHAQASRENELADGGAESTQEGVEGLSVKKPGLALIGKIERRRNIHNSPPKHNTQTAQHRREQGMP